jgi:hypothetical protein
MSKEPSRITGTWAGDKIVQNTQHTTEKLQPGMDNSPSRESGSEYELVVSVGLIFLH